MLPFCEYCLVLGLGGYCSTLHPDVMELKRVGQTIRTIRSLRVLRSLRNRLASVSEPCL